MEVLKAPRGQPPKDPAKRALYDAKKAAYVAATQNQVVPKFTSVHTPTHSETEDETLERLSKRFDAMRKISASVARGLFRSVVVTGPGGIGKTEEIKSALAPEQAQGAIVEFVKGVLTPINLYKTLWEFRHPNCVIVLDDADGIFKMPDAFRLLKCALDSGDTRQVDWRSEARTLKENDIPNSFDFQGSIIFISNLPLQHMADHGTGENIEHLKALLTRVFLVDLKLHTPRDLMLWVAFMVTKHSILIKQGLTLAQQQEALMFMAEHRETLKTISIRAAKDIGSLMQLYGEHAWRGQTKELMLR